MRIAIIEDEKLTAKDLVSTIEKVAPNARVVAVLHSVEDAISFFKENPPIDLVFSDIQLGDGLSFEIFETIPLKAPIIYCTAFNQYTLKAFETLGIYYILKPFSDKTVQKALNKYVSLKGAIQSDVADVPNQQNLIALLKEQLAPKQPSSIIIQKGDKIIPLATKDIALFFIENDLVFAYTLKGDKHVLTQKLSDLEKQNHQNYFRANRQFLIRRDVIKSASHYFNRKIKIQLNIPFEHEIIVGKVKVASFLDWLAER